MKQRNNPEIIAWSVFQAEGADLLATSLREKTIYECEKTIPKIQSRSCECICCSAFASSTFPEPEPRILAISLLFGWRQYIQISNEVYRNS